MYNKILFFFLSIIRIYLWHLTIFAKTSPHAKIWNETKIPTEIFIFLSSLQLIKMSFFSLYLVPEKARSAGEFFLSQKNVQSADYYGWREESKTAFKNKPKNVIREIKRQLFGIYVVQWCKKYCTQNIGEVILNGLDRRILEYNLIKTLVISSASYFTFLNYKILMYSSSMNKL